MRNGKLKKCTNKKKTKHNYNTISIKKSKNPVKTFCIKGHKFSML